MSLHQAIDSANCDDRTGLIIYAIPGFPSPEIYQATIGLLDNSREVSIIETTVPVAGGFSDHTNDVIGRAHHISRKTPKASHHSTVRSPMLSVIYREQVELYGFQEAISRLSSNTLGVLLEWDEKQQGEYFDICNQAGVELVQCVGPWMSREEIAQVLAYAIPEPLVYLMSASMTGAQLFSNDDIRQCVDQIRETCPEAKIAAGFGIATANDIARLKEGAGIDAVIIGTAFLKSMDNGFDYTKGYLQQISQAL